MKPLELRKRLKYDWVLDLFLYSLTQEIFEFSKVALRDLVIPRFVVVVVVGGGGTTEPASMAIHDTSRTNAV